MFVHSDESLRHSTRESSIFSFILENRKRTCTTRKEPSRASEHFSNHVSSSRKLDSQSFVFFFCFICILSFRKKYKLQTSVRNGRPGPKKNVYGGTNCVIA